MRPSPVTVALYSVILLVFGFLAGLGYVRGQDPLVSLFTLDRR